MAGCERHLLFWLHQSLMVQASRSFKTDGNGTGKWKICLWSGWRSQSTETSRLLVFILKVFNYLIDLSIFGFDATAHHSFEHYSESITKWMELRLHQKLCQLKPTNLKLYQSNGIKWHRQLVPSLDIGLGAAALVRFSNQRQDDRRKLRSTWAYGHSGTTKLPTPKPMPFSNSNPTQLPTWIPITIRIPTPHCLFLMVMVPS